MVNGSNVEVLPKPPKCYQRFPARTEYHVTKWLRAHHRAPEASIDPRKLNYILTKGGMRSCAVPFRTAVGVGRRAWPFVAWTFETEGRRLIRWGARGEISGMPVILIECPIGGREFSTGIIIDKASFDVLREVTARALCPYCGQEHEWRKSDARLAEAVPPDEWIENQNRQHA